LVRSWSELLACLKGRKSGRRQNGVGPDLAKKYPICDNSMKEIVTFLEGVWARIRQGVWEDFKKRVSGKEGSERGSGRKSGRGSGKKSGRGAARELVGNWLGAGWGCSRGSRGFGSELVGAVRELVAGQGLARQQEWPKRPLTVPNNNHII